MRKLLGVSVSILSLLMLLSSCQPIGPVTSTSPQSSPALVTGSTGNSTNAAQPDLYFPVQKEPQTVLLAALLPGKLVVDNGYLRVKGELILWPYGYSLKTEKNEILVFDEKDQAVARVGDDVRLGGGELDALFVEGIIGHKLLAGVAGPFWLMGDIVKN